jgi:O-antigen/teichoic acid export membrane protein
MSTIKRNITANFLGRVITILTSIAFVPVYIKYLGIEAYGVIGFFVTIQTILNLLDFGMGATVNREMATLSVSTERGKELLDTKKTFEYIYWIASAVALITVLAASGFIAHRWLNKSQLDVSTVNKAIMIMGVSFFFQFPWNMYNSALLGLQKQITPNIISVIIALIKAIGSILILRYVSATLVAFLLFQTVCIMLQTISAALYLKWVLRMKDLKAQFSKAVLKKNWRFSVGLFFTSILIVMLTQVDKLLLSTLVPLHLFGYYVLAGNVSSNLEALILPIQTAYFPRLTQLNALGDEEGLKQKFHQGSQLIALLVIPVGTVLFFLSKQVLFVWTGDLTIADSAYLLLSILIFGMMFNTLMTIPYALTIATGWVKFGSRICGIALLFLIPFVFFSTKKYGVTGGAMAWALLNIGFLIFAMQYFFSRLMKTEKSKWYWQTIFLPLLIAFPLGTAFYFIYQYMPYQLSRWEQLIFLGVAYLVITSSIILLVYRNIFSQLPFLSVINKARNAI